jgi:hypothetical protein
MSATNTETDLPIWIWLKQANGQLALGRLDRSINDKIEVETIDHDQLQELIKSQWTQTPQFHRQVTLR